MPTPTKGPRLGGSPAHQKLMLANLATSLFTHGKIHTTRAKAERLRPYAERLITKAKGGDLHARREISKVIRDKDVVHRLLAEIGPFFADRPGGYTRIVKTLPRKGDNAPMAIIELVNEKLASTEASAATRSAASRGSAATVGAPATGAAATAATIAASESTSEQGSDDVTPGTDTAENAAAMDEPEGTVPEAMADNAAASAGLDTGSSDTGSTDTAASETESTGTASADTDTAPADNTVTDLVVEPEDKS